MDSYTHRGNKLRNLQGIFPVEAAAKGAVWNDQHVTGSKGSVEHASAKHSSRATDNRTIGADYTSYQELGGNARTYMINGQVSYAFSPDTRLYFRTDYLKRDSSAALQALSPFTRSFDDVRVTIGLTHTLL